MAVEDNTPQRIPMRFGSSSGVLSEGYMTIENTGTDETISIEEKNAEQEALDNQGIVAFVHDRFRRAKDARFTDEQRWIAAYKNYRGLADNPEVFQKTEKSKVQIKITKTKTLAAHAQIGDILFSGNRFPIGAESTPIPDGIPESVSFDPQDPSQNPPGGQQQGQGGQPPQAPQSPSGQIPTSRPGILENLGNLTKRLTGIEDKIQEGPGLTPTSHTWEPARETARRVDKKFQDMLEEANANKKLDRTVLDMCIYGTGVFKGPMAKLKEYPKWDESGAYVPETKAIADFCNVSIWDSYFDPEARTIDELSFFVERHRMNKTQLRALKKRPYFRKESIEKAIKDGPNYTKEYWENTLEDYKNEASIETFEVLEFWGVVDKSIEEIAELEIPKEYKDLDEVQVNIWVCNNYPIRVVFNPFTPARIPYFIIPYEVHPHSLCGIGVPENMSDSQMLMDGFMRMAVDNAALSGSLMLEVNTTFLAAGQSPEVHPGKVWYTEGPLGQAIRDIKFNNTTQENFIMFDKARQLADESTGIPSYSHGQSNIQSVGRTAAGMSMLMGAAALNIKNVIRNIDEYLLIPLGKAMYSYLMQFDFNKDYIGDIEIKAKGTQSLMQNEVRAQKLLQALQVTGNPMDAPFVRRDYLIRELMESLDVDSDKSVNDPRQAAIQADIMKQLMLAQGIDPTKQQAQPGANAGGGTPNADTTGGNIAPGAAPPPGAPGFSGTGGGANGNNPQGQVTNPTGGPS